MLNVKRVISYKIDNENKIYYDYLNDYLFCLPELLEDNIRKLLYFSANNYFNDKYNISSFNLDNIYKEQKNLINDTYELADIRNDITDCIVVINKKNKKYGFLNLNGDIVIPCMYDYADEFVNGLARVEIDGKGYFINKENQIITVQKTNKNLNYDQFALKNACLYYPNHIRRYNTLRSLSYPESCQKFNAWSYCMSEDKIYLATEYSYEFLILDNDSVIATINDEERIKLIRKLKNI